MRRLVIYVNLYFSFVLLIVDKKTEVRAAKQKLVVTWLMDLGLAFSKANFELLEGLKLCTSVS